MAVGTSLSLTDPSLLAQWRVSYTAADANTLAYALATDFSACATGGAPILITDVTWITYARGPMDAIWSDDGGGMRLSDDAWQRMETVVYPANPGNKQSLSDFPILHSRQIIPHTILGSTRACSSVAGDRHTPPGVAVSRWTAACAVQNDLATRSTARFPSRRQVAFDYVLRGALQSARAPVPGRVIGLDTSAVDRFTKSEAILSLSLVVPAYNEEKRLAGTLGELMRYFDDAASAYEVIVVDDGSSDGTAALVRRMGETRPRLKLITTPHRGKGHAVRLGMLAARGACIVFCDADLPVPPVDVSRVADLLHEFPVVIGSREHSLATRIGEPRFRHMMGRLFNMVVRVCALPGLQDTQCGVKGFTAASARAVFSRQSIDGFGFDVEVLYVAKRCGYEVKEMPVTWAYRALSRVDPLRDSIRMFCDVVRVRWRDLRGHYDWPALADPWSVH